MMSFFLPVYSIIDSIFLRLLRLPEIDACHVNSAMSEQVREQRDVILSLQKFDREAVPEAVRMHDLLRDAVPFAERFQARPESAFG